MKIEKEIKIKVSSPKSLIPTILKSGFQLWKKRYFEDNLLFDFQEKPLLKRGCILRLRIVNGKGTLTYKEPSSLSSIMKVRKEIETSVENVPSISRILINLGLSVIFRYQKYRRIYKKGNILLSIDETPIGNFIELEGEEYEIIAIAEELGFSASQFIKESYMELFYKEREGNMVFDEG
ncbi:MAG: class IV adenylate cyclase [Candidatus Aminicenantia bacterium]